MIAHPRFWKKTQVSTEHSYNGTPCIDWTANKNEDGYGHFHFEGKLWRSHRMSYVFEHGDIPDGMCVCHHCDRPCCVNPEHLFLGSHQDNMKDMMAKERLNAPIGERSRTAKLTAADVRLIKQFLQRHPPVKGDGSLSGQCDFAARWFGVSSSNVGNIYAGRFWKHITLEGATS